MLFAACNISHRGRRVREGAAATDQTFVLSTKTRLAENRKRGEEEGKEGSKEKQVADQDFGVVRLAD